MPHSADSDPRFTAAETDLGPLEHARREERQRLSQILHDHIQQLLVAAKMQAELAAGATDNSPRERLRAIVSLLDDALTATRDLAVRLSPPLLHDQGLPAALEWLLVRTAKQLGLLVEANLDPAANPPGEAARELLFQAAQEFLLNTAKHARTKQATLTLSRNAGRIRLEVADRGVGFAAAHIAGSFGLSGLRQSLEAIGGSLHIDSSPGSGVRAAAETPALTH